MAIYLITASRLVAHAAAWLALTLITTMAARAQLDLSQASVFRLDNGLTLLVLEDHSVPVASVQMAYRVGGRNDPAGLMGLAHFFEHMAFRSSTNFPDTGLVSEIYAVGGEWHGYTWIDQTTYFATVPRAHLDLLLRIEADRLGRLDLLESDIEVEKRAVLTEMNQYDNDTDTRLFDALLAAHFQVHPYGNNTIGYEGDVKAITHADVVNFYRQYVNPANAVLAVAGDVDTNAVKKRVEELFAGFDGPAVNTLPPVTEPTEAATRSVTLRVAADEPAIFRIAYPAPAATSDDFAAFLVLQELVGGGAGASFLQNDWGTAVREDAPLAGVAAQMTTWLIPSAQPYVFVVSGTANTGQDRRSVAGNVQAVLDQLASEPVSAPALRAAATAVRRALRFDVESPEDAAHQLAFFESIGAFDTLLALPAEVAAVTANDIARVAQRYLSGKRRTVAWALPDDGQLPFTPEVPSSLSAAKVRAGSAPADPAARSLEPQLFADGRIAVEYSPTSPTLAIAAVIPGRWSCEACRSDTPSPGYTTLALRGLAGELDMLLQNTQRALAAARLQTPPYEPAGSTDPARHLQELLDSAFTVSAADPTAQPAFLAIAGDVDTAAAATAAEAFSFTSDAPSVRVVVPATDLAVSLPVVKPQGALGYLVAAPPRRSRDSLAWELALYIFSHGYEGRFGKAAISDRGLAYYIEADYRGGPDAGLVTLAAGVDPVSQAPLVALLRSELARFVADPPSAEELAEAKAHLAGRRMSGALSPAERVERLASDWVGHGLMASDVYADAVAAVTLDQLHAVLPAFAQGRVVTVSVGVP
jgi:zinc protease